MKKILSFMCFSITFFVVNGQTRSMLKDTSSVKFSVRSNGYRSKTPILKIPTDSNVHYHMKYKKTDENYSSAMPNAFNYASALESKPNPQIKKTAVRPMFKSGSIQDSIFGTQSLPIKRIED